jgi:hypothetical protein
MDWPVTLIAAAAALGLTVLFGWLGARPPNILKGPRLVPHRFLMLLSAVAVMILLVHALNLAGFSTGAGRP